MSLRSRLVAAGIAVALAFTAFATPEASAHTSPEAPVVLPAPVLPAQVLPAEDASTTASQAAAYVAAQFAAKPASFSTGDLSDAIVGLQATGGQQATVNAMMTRLEATAPAYAKAPGPAAKVALAVMSVGQDPTNFAGIDLIKVIKDGLAANPSAGYVANQALAVMALARAGETVPNAVVQHMIDTQLANGSWGWGTNTDPDSSGLMIAALAILPCDHPLLADAQAAKAKALKWAADAEIPPGYWQAYSAVNTTAWVSQGLLTADQDITRTLTWLSTQQNEDGGMLYNGKSNLMATVQVLPVLVSKTYLTAGVGGLEATPCTTLPTHPASGTFGDHTGDRAADVYVVNAQRTLELWKGGTGDFVKVSSHGKTLATAGRVVQVGDLTGDRRSDVLAQEANGDLSLYAGTANGGLAYVRQVGRNWQGIDHITYMGTMDGSGRKMVVARTKDGRLFSYSLDQHGLKTVKQVGRGWNGIVQMVSLGDLTGDGLSDLLAVRPDGTLWVYRTKADGTFAGGPKTGQGWGGAKAIFTPGDLNGDGRFDLVGVNSAGTMTSYINVKLGTLRARTVATGFGAARNFA